MEETGEGAPEIPSGWQLGTFRPKGGDREHHETGILRALTQEETEKVDEAYQYIAAHSLDESYELVKQNHDDWQRFLAHVEGLLRAASPAELPHPFEIGRAARHRFANWLLSVRLFLQHTEIQLNRDYGKDSVEFNAFKDVAGNCWDNSFSYRFIDQLRNYGEHSRLPAIAGRVEDEGNGWELRLWFNRDELLSTWKNWKASVREELRQQPVQIPVLEHVEAMTEHLRVIAEKVEEIQLPALRAHIDYLNRLLSEVSPEKGSPEIFRLKEDGTGIEIKPLVMIRHILEA